MTINSELLTYQQFSLQKKCCPKNEWMKKKWCFVIFRRVSGVRPSRTSGLPRSIASPLIRSMNRRYRCPSNPRRAASAGPRLDESFSELRHPRLRPRENTAYSTHPPPYSVSMMRRASIIHLGDSSPRESRRFFFYRFASDRERCVFVVTKRDR